MSNRTHPSDTTTRRISRRSQDTRSSRLSAGGTCKTCVYCRQKKVKCDGSKPQCNACIVNGQECIYPQDGRRDARQPTARVQNLESSLSALWGHLKAMGLLNSAACSSEMPDLSAMLEMNAHNTPRADDFNFSLPTVQDPSVSLPVNRMLSPPHTHSPQTDGPNDRDHVNDHEDYYGQTSVLQDTPSQIHAPSRTMGSNRAPLESNEASAPEISSLSPCEARVAGVLRLDGCNSVHGLSSILNPQLPRQKPGPTSTTPSDRKAANSAVQARLVSNAALQRQRESSLFRQPSNTLDLDGVSPEMAKHLFDLHWNRQHYAYLLSYRPAIMDSLANNGPWANKLLLNAIYYSSCLYSDRQCLKSDTSNPQTSGSRFYDRFRQLLGDAIVQPSIPSATALLLCGSTLVSQGRPSAGWTLCGTAYRMIIDMGIHLMLEPPTNQQERSSSYTLKMDIEQEMSKRLYWGAFITDAAQSLYLGRSPALSLVEARVPQLFLDTFEELEDWSPYVDPTATGLLQPDYVPRPAYAVSTFNAMIRLFQISSHISRTFYSLEAIKQTTETLVAAREETRRRLEDWRSSLPPHLRLNLDEDTVPPPHQITPHTTFHVLNIMLQRPFLEENHLRRHSSLQEKDIIAKVCIDHAISIWKLVDAYRRAFTLRRAPFLLSYAVYSAVIVILKREPHERELLSDSISFFWMALSELQRGCNFGLKKSLSALRDMMAEMGESQLQIQSQYSETNMSMMFDRFAGRNTSRQGFSPMSHGLGQEFVDPLMQDLEFGSFGFLNDQERIISDDALYGLFAPQQNFF